MYGFRGLRFKVSVWVWGLWDLAAYGFEGSGVLASRPGRCERI